MKVLIVGGGIAGLTLANFLQDSGIEYSIIEKHADWQHEGYSLGMWNNGRAVLRKLGLGDDFDKLGIPFQKLVIRDGAGKVLKNYNFSKFNIELGEGLTHLRRGDLHDWLIKKIPPEKIRMGTALVGIRESGRRAIASFSSGPDAAFDAIIGADGIHSKVRELCFKDHLEAYTNWRAWYFWADRSFAESHSAIEYVAAGRFALVFDERDKALVVAVARSPHAEWDMVEGRIERLKALFEGKVSCVSHMLEGVRPEEILPTDLVTVSLKQWHVGRAVLVGDAAHGFEPFAGMGGSMALEDAYVLAGELIKAHEASKDVSAAFGNYQRARSGRVKRARKLTARMGAWLAIRSPLVRQAVNAGMPYVPERLFADQYFKFLKEEL